MDGATTKNNSPLMTALAPCRKGDIMR